MKRLAVVAAVLSAITPAWAGSPFYEKTDTQKRKMVVPYIRALTGCVADLSLRDPDGSVQYRAGLFAAYVTHQLRNCPAQMNDLLDNYEATYGDGEAEKFINGPYLADLKRAVLSLIKPQLDAKVEEAQRQEAVEREAARQRDEDVRLRVQVRDAARAEAEKQRFIDSVFTKNDTGRDLSSLAKRENTQADEPIFNPPPPPTVIVENTTQHPAQDDIEVYAAVHQTTSAEIIRQTGMSAMDIADFVRGGKKGGQTPDQVISGLIAVHVAVPDQNTLKTTALGVNDKAKIIDTYKKNEMRFVRDFKGRHFEDDISFDNARQNLTVSGTYTVIFGEGGFGGNITCQIADPKEIGVIADWDKGDRVHVSGDIKDVTFGDVQLIDCTMRHR